MWVLIARIYNFGFPVRLISVMVRSCCFRIIVGQACLFVDVSRVKTKALLARHWIHPFVRFGGMWWQTLL